jgi:hypothetical protein
MSFTYTKEVFKCPLPGMEKLILWVLAERASDEGRCFPGQARIAKDAGLSYSAVQRNLDKLIAKGLVRITGQQRYKNTFALSSREYELNLVAIKGLVAESLHSQKPRAATAGSGELPAIGGELPAGSGEPTGVVAESFLNQSYNQSLDLSEKQSGEAATATEHAAAAVTPPKPSLSDREHNFLEHWYGVRGPLELSEAEPIRIEADLPLVREILSVVPNGNALLSFVFTDPGDDKWAGWDAKTPNLPALLKHVRKGEILSQLAKGKRPKAGGKKMSAYEEEIYKLLDADTPKAKTPDPACPKCKGRGEIYFSPEPGQPELADDCDCLNRVQMINLTDPIDKIIAQLDSWEKQ